MNGWNQAITCLKKNHVQFEALIHLEPKYIEQNLRYLVVDMEALALLGFPGEDSRSNVWPQVAVKVATHVAKTCWKPQPLKILWKSFKENPWPKFVFFQLRFCLGL